jgi:hypothetical protein
MRDWPRMLAAVLTGNLIYFALLMPRLPLWLRHRPYHIDAGLLLDFALCLAIHLLLGRYLRGSAAKPGGAGPSGGGAQPPDPK